MTAALVCEVASSFGVHRYAVHHWQVLRPFVEGTEKDPKELFFLANDIWDLWPYARHGTPSYRARYRLKFGGLHSFLRPFVKWHCYQQVLQRPGDVRTSLTDLPYQLKRTDDYLIEHGYTSLDDLTTITVFEDLWTALLPQRISPFTYHDVRLQSATRPFWLHVSAMFGAPLLVPPIAPYVRNRYAETGIDERSLIPQPVIAQLVNKLALHRDGTGLLNRFHHLRLCVLLLSICLGRRITEVLLAPRGEGPHGPLTTYPARGKGKDGGLWFRFEPNKDGPQNQVYISPAWHDLVRYCVKSILFYSDEVRHLAPSLERNLFILVSGWNLTCGGHSHLSHATEHDTDYDYRHLNKQNEKRWLPQIRQTARAMMYEVFFNWLVGHYNGKTNHRLPSIFEQWGITADGSVDGKIYYMRTQQARHSRQSALAQDPTISPLTRQRDLNHTSRDMQLVYQHHLQGENAKLRERIAQPQLHGLGTYWLEQCLGLVESGAHPAFREGSPTLAAPRWRALIVNNPQFVQANRVLCGLCALPQGPAGCQEFMHCTEATVEGCAWFLTDPNDMQMQRELHERANEHRAKQQESRASGRTMQAHKYGVMAERTERLRNESLQKASDEVRRALLDELNASEEES
jgi:hypothetical protein